MKWRPIFSSPRLRGTDGMLSAMILVAIFVHGIVFYLVQTIAPANPRPPISNPRLTILDSSREADRDFLRWIELNDPAAIALHSIPAQPPQELLTLRYRPSFEKNLPTPLPVDFGKKTGERPLFFPPGQVPDFGHSTATKPRLHPAPPTQVRLSPALPLTFSEPLIPPIITTDSPAPTRFLVITAPDTAFIFLEKSSGLAALDTAARTWLARANFPAGRAIGWVDIHWGADTWKKSTP